MTGHRGLIGSCLLQRLQEQGDEVAGLIDSRDGSDIRDIEKLPISGPVDVLIHLASFCKINKIIQEPGLSISHNVLGTSAVMEFCRKRGIPKVIFTSSSRVLSHEKNPYTAGKIFGEELVKGYRDCYGIDFVILRPSTVYGPFNDLTGRLIDTFILNALTSKPLRIYGDKDKTLDFTYVDDFADATLLAMDQENEVFDVSGDQEVRVNYLAELIIGLNGGQGSIEHHPPEVAQPQRVKVDITKLRQLGYKPKVSIEEGVERCYRWYSQHLREVLAARGDNSH